MTEQYWMYQLASQLMNHEQYEIVYLNTKRNEVWLSKNEKNQTNIIRLIPQGFDWKNHLRTDVASVFQRVQSMKRIFLRKNVEIYNVYVASYEPIDDWSMYKKRIQLQDGKNIAMNVFYLTAESFVSELKRLLKELGSKMEFVLSLPTETEQEQAIFHYKEKFRNRLRERDEAVRRIFTYGKPRITYVLLGLNIFLFFLVEITGGTMNVEHLIESGAKYNPAILAGEWWRMISSMFLHIGGLHLFMNMLALYYLGTVVERIYGSVRFIIIYFFAGIGGSLTSFAFNVHVAAGASGALFGLFGALLYFGTVYRALFFQTMGKNLLFVLVINLIFGFLVPQIDMGAHLGGLVMGFIAAGITSLPKTGNVLRQLVFTLIFIILTFALVVYGIWYNVQVFSHTMF